MSELLGGVGCLLRGCQIHNVCLGWLGIVIGVSTTSVRESVVSLTGADLFPVSGGVKTVIV